MVMYIYNPFIYVSFYPFIYLSIYTLYISGIGANKAFIQYDNSFKGLKLKTLKEKVSAQIK